MQKKYFTMEIKGNEKKIEIPIQVDEKDFYRKYLEIYKPILLSVLKQINNTEVKLYQKELDILSEMLFYANKSGDINNHDKYIFNSKIRKEIRENVGLDVQGFNTHLSNMRAKKLIIDNKINQYCLIRKYDNLYLTFKFTTKK